MVNEQHSVKLTAQDGLSKTFEKVGQSAQKAGKDATQAAEKATRATGQWTDATKKIGAGLGVLGGIAIKMANDSERSQVRLEQAIESTGKSFDDYAASIDKASEAAVKMAFDDEDAADSIAALTLATGDAAKAIELQGLAMDLARAKGVSLASATETLIQAEAGRYRSLQSLGIVVDETMSKEQVYAEIQAKTAGQAEAYAKTNAAAWDRMGITVGNALETAGGYLADFQVPLLALGSVATVAGPVIDGIKGIGDAAAKSAVGVRLLSSAWMGPVGIVVGAAAVGLAIWQLTKDHDDLAEAADRAAEREDRLTGSLSDLADQLERVGLLTEAQNSYAFFEEITVGAEEAEAAVSDLQDEQANFSSFADAHGKSLATVIDGHVVLTDALGNQSMAFSETTSQALIMNEALDDGILTTEELAAAGFTLTKGFEAGADTLKKYEDAFTAAMGLAADPRYNGEAIIKNIDNINRAVEMGTITEEQGLALLEAISAEREKYNRTLNKSTDLVNFNTQSVVAQNTAMAASEDAWLAGHQAMAGMNDSVKETTGSVTDLTKAFMENAAAQQLGGRERNSSDALAKAKEEAAAAAQHALDLSEAFGLGNGKLNIMAQLTETVVDNLGLGLALATENLNNVFRIGVKNLDAINQTVDSVIKWGAEMVGVEGTMGHIDDLRAKGLISEERYGMHQRSYNRMLEDQASIAEDILEIQADQIPIIENALDSTRDYVDAVADLEGSAQTAALGWMDAGEAMKFLNIQTELGVAANSEFGSASRVAMDSYIQGIIATDPYMTAMLEQAGYLTKTLDSAGNWTGEWTVNWDNADEINSAMDDLVTNLGNLVTILADIFNIDMDDSDVTAANERVTQTQEDLLTLDSTTADPNVTLSDGATNLMNGIETKLGTIDGTTAIPNIDADATDFWNTVNGIPNVVDTVYIDVWFNQRNDPGNGAYALGGVIGNPDHAALGRMTRGRDIIVGENGPERLSNVPYGALVTPAHATNPRGVSSSGGDGGFNNYGSITIVADNPRKFAEELRQYTRVGRNRN